MTRRIGLLIVTALLAVALLAASAAPSFAAKTTTFQKSDGCVTKAGQGGGSGSVKEQRHGSCNGNGSSF